MLLSTAKATRTGLSEEELEVMIGEVATFRGLTDKT